ncbi:DUF2065 domain-containing protein [Parvibium lacunae]|uniref:DUF2065 domain-containing protein n=1 Tax=Parvibium lacunae TaxID=1888893 RepID=A0A368L8B3_9BURK|nr:DUF2065 domain-containing protein [Parvibium lacunae]RCS59844.1 DUF2065 domain-containing protein [Parvibium lacunae]
MTSSVWLLALGMLLVFEGILPLLMPQAWRETFLRLTQLRDGQLRFFGLLSVGLGLLLVAVFS